MVFSRFMSARTAWVIGSALLAALLLMPRFETPARAGQALPGSLGINLAKPTYWSGERSFMNLASGGEWMSVRQGQGWTPFDLARLNAQGNIASLQPGENANAMLVPPESAYGPNAVRVRCRWRGTGAMQPGGEVKNVTPGKNSFEFDWPGATDHKPKTVWITLTDTKAADPVTQIDCREATADEKALFSPDFLKFLRDYKVIRFLDWQGTNANPLMVSWATRTRPETQFQSTDQGAAVEHMVALANQVGADPWFTMLWNGDEDYVRRFAEYVRDNLDPSRKVYVELSNEVWNYVFPATKQAEQEGLEANLSPHRFQAMLWRYAEKTAWMMKIWSEVFAANPDRLVRVIATQHVSAWAVEQLLSHGDTAEHVDALATAPYFGHGVFEGAMAAVKDPVPLFAFLAADVGEAMLKAMENKKLADKYGKRYIAYEAGQHIVSPTEIETVAALNRDPRMHDIYKSYLEAWRAQVGDLMVIFQSSGGISQYGAWGIQEYPGQPLDWTPKRRAILEFVKP